MESQVEFVEDYERLFGARQAYRCARAFMIAYFALIQAPLPEVARHGLDVAQRYLRGEATDADLEAARMACWEALEAREARSDFKFNNPEICALGAPIAFLWPDRDDADLLMSMEVFMKSADCIEDHSTQVEAMLIEHFR